MILDYSAENFENDHLILLNHLVDQENCLIKHLALRNGDQVDKFAKDIVSLCC